MATKTLKDWAQTALDVQDACNLSGVVHDFALFCEDCRELGIDSTQARNEHPISVLFADKIAHLTKQGSNPAVHMAYKWAFDMTRPKSDE